MSDRRVVVTDHDFADLGIERAVLSDVAEVIDLSDAPGGGGSNAGDSDDDGGDGDDRDDGGGTGFEGDGGDTDPEGSLTEADALLNLRRELGREVIDRLDRCRIVARYGIGVDNVDLEAATERGIHVTNVPGYCVEEVATHALALALALVRGVGRYDSSVARGEWDRDVAAPIRRFSTRTVGVVGFGAIGRAFADRVAALGADVVASDPFLSPADLADGPAELVDFGDLVERADLASVHSPLTEETRGMFDADAFARMKESAFLVNVARGPIVDADALLAALDAGEIAGAGLDVFPSEPPRPDHPLRDHPRVIATPHVAWYSEEANEERRRRAAENVRAALLGDRPADAVNDVEGDNGVGGAIDDVEGTANGVDGGT
ncbi:C-terminal binding protein [Halegenticoccus soli]|uniref:C-terminal binding protein n=1 Tax=Halegenticoccus soli TaxID=1985678 RepID=UPI000C6EC0DC|nr:C-terminal binding protein [Halegenticoccus soli]